MPKTAAQKLIDKLNSIQPRTSALSEKEMTLTSVDESRMSFGPAKIKIKLSQSIIEKLKLAKEEKKKQEEDPEEIQTARQSIKS